MHRILRFVATHPALALVPVAAGALVMFHG
jgi:hypothetical protein